MVNQNNKEEKLFYTKSDRKYMKLRAFERNLNDPLQKDINTQFGKFF